MKKLLWLLALVLIPSILPAGESVSVPWEEFKQLYRESVEREIMKTVKKAPEEKKPQTYTIKEAAYCLTIGKQSAEGEVLLSGKIVSGDPEPIPLFNKEIVIANLKRVTGGSLVFGQNDTERIMLLPDGTQTEFQVEFSFFVRGKEDSRSRFISLDIPSALRNSLDLKLSSESLLLEEPGIPDTDGVYHFSLSTSLTVRYLDKEGLSATSVVGIDTFSRIHLQEKRAIITTCFLPIQSLPPSLILRVQQDAQYISSSLKASWIKKLENNSYQLDIPSDEKGSFSIQFAVEESDDGDSFSLSLPRIDDNNGKEGDFVLEEPDDGQISVTGNDLVRQVPVARLGNELGRIAANNQFFMHISPHETIKLDIKRFQSTSTPPVVLDSQYFFTSFVENGSILSVLVMDIPPEVGSRMKVKSIPGTEIWSLTVNGEKREVYKNEDDSWIVPLMDGEVSHVELALLCQGERLGLQGRLETVLPETGLPSRNVRVGIALPERVQLLSMEAPVSPSPGTSWKTPIEFIGRSYFFSRSFYRGEEMKIAVSYKEPVK